MGSTIDEYKAKVVAEWVKAQIRQKDEPITGSATELTCPSCRGTLHVYLRAPPKGLIKGPRQSKNRRIRKKQLKRWNEQIRPLLAFHTFHEGLRLPNYVCVTCKRHVGSYQAIASNAFPIEPMPRGAALYFKDE
jgi:hypothetical protein